MFISFTEFCSNTEGVVRQACQFVGADPSLLHFRSLPPGMQVRPGHCVGAQAGCCVRHRKKLLLQSHVSGTGCCRDHGCAHAAPGMQGERKGRRMHPSCKRKLAQYFAEPNQRLYAMLGVDFSWADPEALGRPRRDAAAYMAPAPQPSYPAGSGLDGRSSAEVSLSPLPPGLHPPAMAADEGTGAAAAVKQEQEQQRAASGGGSSKGSESGGSGISITASSGRSAAAPALAMAV